MYGVDHTSTHKKYLKILKKIKKINVCQNKKTTIMFDILNIILLFCIKYLTLYKKAILK